MRQVDTDVLIYGAGPAGCIAAGILHQKGMHVRIVEKEMFPRFVIGESLLPRVMDHLEEAGLLEAIKAAGFQEKFGAKFIRGDDICDFNFSTQFTQGWNWTWQVPRAQFDQILADKVANKGVEVSFRTQVTHFERKDETSLTTVENDQGETSVIASRFVIDASGYGRVLPRMLGLDKPSNFEKRKTHFTHFKDVHRPGGIDGNRITVVVHQPRTWIWIIPFSNGTTSVGYVADPEFFHAFPEDAVDRMQALVHADENTRERFAGAEMVLPPRTIEGYAISTTRLFGDGFVLCGNATEFLDPVFSSGVTFAMESGNRAAHCVHQHLQGHQVNWQEQYTDYMMQGINTFRSYVAGWYNGTLHDIFFAKEVNEKIKSQICSVLAGYVWDLTNPFVREHARSLNVLATVIRAQKQ